MIEIVWNDSACGSLKQAQSFGKGPYRGGAIAVAVFGQSESGAPDEEALAKARRLAEEHARREWEKALPMGGDPADVYGFHLALSVGEIAESGIGPGRQEALKRLFGVYPAEVARDAAKELLEQEQSALDEVLRRAAAGEALRVWYSDSPDELCGLYWLAEQLDRLPGCGPVSAVKLPDWEIGETQETVISKVAWGEVGPGEWSRYLPLERQLPPAFIKGAASHWRTLAQENAPLRVVVSGQLLSAGEAFYDGFIDRELAAQGEEFLEATVVGNVLGKYQLGVSDGWVALRIEEKLRAGELAPLTQPPADAPLYHRMLKKCKREI